MASHKKCRYLVGIDGKLLQYTERVEKPYYLLQAKPRGQAAGSWEFTGILKERVPLVYLFVVDQVGKGIFDRDPRFQRIVDEWREKCSHHGKPPSRILTAYIVERAMEGAWQLWGIEAPYTRGCSDSFYRRYVQGHPGAIKVFRKKLAEPQPWDRHHVGHELRWFLSSVGEAARHYKLLSKIPSFVPILRIQEF